MSAIPLSPDDLRTLADAVEAWGKALIDENGEYLPFTVTAHSLELQAPNTAEVIGHLVFEDGWIGFEFGDAE